MKPTYFVTGISTEVGKTVCSAVLVKALGADYWKPVQSGDLHQSDTMKVAEWNGVTLPDARFHAERWRLQTPMSPHAAADIDGVAIGLDDFTVPQTANPLILEGAGGLLVPLNHHDTLLDLMAHWQLPTILVSRNYLGSINHTLLSVRALQQAGVPIAGLIFNGKPTPTTESVILGMTGLPVLCQLPELETVSSQTVAALAEKVGPQLRAALL